MNTFGKIPIDIAKEVKTGLLHTFKIQGVERDIYILFNYCIYVYNE